MSKIQKIKWNFRQAGDLKDGLGEDYDVVSIDGIIDFETILNPVTKQHETIRKKVISIDEKWTNPDNRHHWFELVLEDNSVIRIYNPCMVYYSA
jgi:hypothetical protein